MSFHWLSNSWTRGFELVTCGFEHVTCKVELVARAFELMTREFELTICEFELVTHEFELVTRKVELVTHGFELATRGFELALLNFNSYNFNSKLVTCNLLLVTRNSCSSISPGNCFKKEKISNFTTNKHKHLKKQKQEKLHLRKWVALILFYLIKKKSHSNKIFYVISLTFLFDLCFNLLWVKYVLLGLYVWKEFIQKLTLFMLHIKKYVTCA